MPVRIGQRASPSFAQPLELLADCHRRVERFLDALVVVTERAAGGPLDAVHREALETALRYFREAAPRHTQDEEASLFPRLRATADRAVTAALATVDALEADHRGAEAAHAVADALGTRWLGDGRLDADAVADLREALASLQAMYRTHIAVEDAEVFPLARRVLQAEDLAAIGREMAARRGHDPDRPGFADVRPAR